MKANFVAAFCVVWGLSGAGLSMAQSPLAPTASDLKRHGDQSDQKRGQADHAARTEANRPKSENEKFTNSIPSSPEVRPIYRDGGGGIKVTAPLGGNTVSK